MVLGCGLAGADTEARRDGTVRAIETVMPSVVNISTATLIHVRDPWDWMFQELFGRQYRSAPRTQARYSLGSGVVIDESGYILTNDHVVRRADKIVVTIQTNIYEAELVVGSAQSDIALIKVEPRPGEKLQAVKFAREDDLLLGETVLALGNPFGLGGSVSRGILSSLARRPAKEDEPLGIEDWLQTDAPINPGNSGGPLINLDGELIGINVAVFREQQAQGIGFAIPIKRVSEALAEIFTPETRHFWFGARVRPETNTLLVASVQQGSPAEKAGLRGGDMILRIGDKIPNNFVEFLVELYNRSEQREIPLVVRRGDERRNIAVRPIREESVFNAEFIRRKIGATLQPLTPDLAHRLGFAGAEGLVIESVDAKGPAAEAGLRPAHVITAIDGKAVSDLVSAAKLLYAKGRGEEVLLVLLVQQRQGNRIWAGQVSATLKVR